MAAQQDLLASFGKLTEAIQGLAVNNAIKKAQVKVDELNQNAELTQFEKIRQQQSIAKGVGASIIGLGGSASSAQNAMASLAPETPDARLAQLEATGKGTLADATAALKEEEEDRLFKKEERAFKRAKMLQDDAQEHSLQLAGMKANAKGAGKPIPPAVSNKLSELKDNLDQMKRLREGFEANKGAIGPLDSRFKTDKLPDAGAIHPALGVLTPFSLSTSEAVYKKDVEDFFNQYRKIITGAAASMPELKGLLKAIPTSGDRQDVFAGSMDMHIEKVQKAISNRLNLLEAQGRDVSDLRMALGLEEEDSGVDPYGAPTAPAGSAAAPGGLTIQWDK